MDLTLSPKEAAARWGCTERSVQLLCRQGRIPGARKISGVWLLPRDAVHPRRQPKAAAAELHPEQLYGRSAAVHVTDSPKELPPEESGCIITEYPILEGISLIIQDIHAEHLDYAGTLPVLPPDLLAIQHCREGRFEGAYPNGECIYMGPGSLSVNLPAWAPVTNSFPLHHYHGLYIAVQPIPASAAIRQLEDVLGPLHIDFSALSARLSEKNRLAFFPEDAGISRLLESLYQNRTGDLQLPVLELLQHLCAQESLPPQQEQFFPRSQVEQIKAVRQYLIDHPDRSIPLADLAATFHLSLTGMKTCFKAVYGQTIGRYLRDYRMQLAAQQLRRTQLRVIDIAASLGYQNASKFSAVFAAHYGMSPQAYRKNFCPPGVIPDREE